MKDTESYVNKADVKRKIRVWLDYRTSRQVTDGLLDLIEKLPVTVKGQLETTLEREWVSVKDRLPEIADNSYTSDVLLCYSTDDGRMWFSTYEENGFGQRGFEVEKYYGVNVTHWMYLPTPPESEDADGDN